MTDTDTAGCLSPEVERLLPDVLADGFTVYCCGPKTAPTALAATYDWPDCIDVITIRDFDRITAARTSTRGNVDVFAPERSWCGPMKAHRNRPCGRYSTSHTRSIPTLRTVSTPHRGPCISAGSNNAP
jgi:hypothetical protein